ncbi:MAG TPA: DUF4932 domain-containing protein, partial [Bacteroidales bacterium]|nr:DUF4932 domain-containing protein [Bacteroidales bacterium]
MKKSAFSVILVFALTMFVFGNEVSLKPVFDERTELMSIVFRLAGAPEYNNNTTVESYTSKVDEYFNPFSDHEVVKLAKLVRRKNGVSYDAVMSMAVHLEIRIDSLFLIKDVLESSLDERWGNYSSPFVAQLNDFYRKTKFKYFFDSNKEFYSVVENRFSSITDKVDLNWFQTFFGAEASEKYNVIISLINYGNYGPCVRYTNGITDIFSINCAWDVDSAGIPVFRNSILKVLVHEMCHSFCNPAGDKFFPEMDTVAEKFFRINENKFNMQAYGKAYTIVNEILVRASAIMYFIDHGCTIDEVKDMILYEQGHGFIWIDQLVELLKKYENNRTQYPTFESIMPEVAKLQNSLDPEAVNNALSEYSPRIVSFSIADNSINIDPTLEEIIVVFDRPMGGVGTSWGIGGRKSYPKIQS